jgi:hypothetical protein
MKPTGPKKRGRPPKQEDPDASGQFRWPFSDWPIFSAFSEFNEAWKGQLSLQKKIKKLESEVAKDYRLGNRARYGLALPGRRVSARLLTWRPRPPLAGVGRPSTGTR